MAMATDSTDIVSQELINQLQTIVGAAGVLADEQERLVYDCDGFIVDKTMPDVVVFPHSTEQVSQIVKACNAAGVPFLARGSGTSLSGGCLPIGGGVMIVLTRMKEILEVSLRNRYAVVQSGVINLKLTTHLKGTGYHYAPDPSSQGACTIGGNIVTNSGGPHTLKYGVTVNHVLGLKAVLSDGSIVEFGSRNGEAIGYDLAGLFCGTEGTFGIVTEATVRITRDPAAYRTMRAVFNSVHDATQAISGIIGAGIVPAALEMMDQGALTAVEQAFHYGFPLDAGALLIIEVDGLDVGLDHEANRIIDICNQSNAREVIMANSAKERQMLWKCRKQAFGALGRLSPSYCTQDGVVPRTKIPEILEFVMACAERHRIRIVNVFHAGDGNIHPILLFDERDQNQIQTVLKASEEILDKCLELEGSVTGEHGIGVEKLNFMSKIFSEYDLDVMQRIKNVFNPSDLCSTRKVLPRADTAEIIRRNHPGRKAGT